jgi:hypothetical protein
VACSILSNEASQLSSQILSVRGQIEQLLIWFDNPTFVQYFIILMMIIIFGMN